MIPAQDLASVFGGWPNLFQGLGSAIVGGVVAALTALLVVRMTHHADQRLAAEVDARSSARAMVAAVGEIAGTLETALKDVDRRAIDQLYLRFLVADQAHRPAISAVDQDFDQSELSRRVKAVTAPFSRLTGAGGAKLPTTTEEGERLGDELANGSQR